MRSKTTIPRLRAEWCPDGRTIRVWCRPCKRFHVHGVTDLIAGGTTHRVAHCTNKKSKHLSVGYLIEVPPLPTELSYS